jgi:hypothetical protein
MPNQVEHDGKVVVVIMIFSNLAINQQPHVILTKAGISYLKSNVSLAGARHLLKINDVKNIETSSSI